MTDEYNLYSEFSAEKHKQKYIHYLEVVIDENGKIMYAVPSHQEKMILLACEKLCVDRDGLDKMCPEDYYCDFFTWLSKVSGACAVWENFVEGYWFNEKQIQSLQMLKDCGLYLGEIPWEVIK